MIRTTGRRPVIAAVAAAAAVPWLAAVDGGAAGRWATVALIAAPLAAGLVPAALRALPRLAPSETAAVVALAAAATAALAGLTAATASPGRDLLLALTVTVPVSAAALAFRKAPAMAVARVSAPAPAPPARPKGPAAGTTRRNFIQLGAAGGVAVAGLSRIAPAAKAQPPVPFLLTITEGDLKMVDGTLVFFRGFRSTSSTVDVPQIPGPPIGNVGPGVKGREVFEGEAVQIVVANTTGRDHMFLIERTDSEAPVNPVVGPVTIPAHGSKTIDFTAPDAGSYIYRDADRNNRLLGMYGAFIVQAAGVSGQLLPYAPAPDRLNIKTELRTQMTWMLSDVDPVLGELARTQTRKPTIDYPLSKILPRYFLINGETGVDATRNANFTVPIVPLEDPTRPFAGVLIRCINTGVAAHSLHWHGNHVFPVEFNAVPAAAGMALERDVQEVRPLQRIDVILPAHTGYDSFPPLPQIPVDQFWPMHCHAEMSQTAGGGSYPFGMLTDWHLARGTSSAEALAQQLGEQAKTGRTRVPEDQVQAAIDNVVKNSSGPGGGSSGSSGSGGGNGSRGSSGSNGSGDKPGKD